MGFAGYTRIGFKDQGCVLLQAALVSAAGSMRRGEKRPAKSEYQQGGDRELLNVPVPRASDLADGVATGACRPCATPAKATRDPPNAPSAVLEIVAFQHLAGDLAPAVGIEPTTN